MASSELIVVDVGHGNCAIIQHGTEAIVIDAPAKPIVARILDELGIQSINYLVLSHADADHLSGAVPLILNRERPVAHVYVNPDRRTSQAWLRFRQAVATAHKEFQTATTVHPSVSTADSGTITMAGTTLHIVHPQPEMCLTGTGGIDIDGQKVTANNMSAVVLVEHNGNRICLLAGDADRRSLDRMVDNKANLHAQILIFPHHGGRAAVSDNRSFARDLVASVEPSVVLFSLGRGSHGTPRPEIVAGVREAMTEQPSPYIACTQLSARCATVLPASAPRVLDSRSDGFKDNRCCAGTLTLSLADDGLAKLLADLAEHHGNFVTKEVPGALCRKTLTAR
ncbi:ComEC/Rec2 family competence protein [Luteimonas panaciterrae]|uniref:ComEC/Rec2 family competence protein n=1 Tax=Luteimonas panaciterrae TaxID=363885 RepID=UPI001CFB9343|nr:MBL fold metallo-hydrolase [Luteimonas panaciterrae]